MRVVIGYRIARARDFGVQTRNIYMRAVDDGMWVRGLLRGDLAD